MSLVQSPAESMASYEVRPGCLRLIYLDLENLGGVCFLQNYLCPLLNVWKERFLSCALQCRIMCVFHPSQALVCGISAFCLGWHNAPASAE